MGGVAQSSMHSRYTSHNEHDDQHLVKYIMMVCLEMHIVWKPDASHSQWMYVWCNHVCKLLVPININSDVYSIGPFVSNTLIVNARD